MSGTYVTLDYDNIQRADIEKQNYTVAPRNWYIDARIVCLTCNDEFLFSVDEQRVWYEEYRFYVDSFPNQCRACRRAARRIKRLRQQYDDSISTALTGSDIDAKRDTVRLIDSLIDCGCELPPKIVERRDTLLAQIRNFQGDN